MRKLLVAATVLGALVFAGVANASTSSNWAGYATAGAGQTFTDVKGSWVVPPVTCPQRGSTYSSFWVGLGGYASGATGLEQIGTSSDCRNGQPVYSSWWELIPAPSVDASLAVSPGDTVSAEVSVSGTTVTLALADTTTGQSFTTTQTVAAPDLTSAEWIAEAPSQCSGSTLSRCTTLPLASFGTATFTFASATANGVAGAISSPSWTPDAIQLVPRVPGSGSATAGALSPDGTSFTVTAASAPAPPSVRVVVPHGRHGWIPWGGWHRHR
jgi:hypothetical protein